MADKYLFMYTIGPVQSYIEQARKTQDLFAGSRILSRLSECGMRTVKDSNGEILFPAFKGDADSKKISYPNRFVALIETEDIDDFGSEVDTAVKEKFKEMLPPNKVSNSNIQIAYEQIKSHLRTFWTAVLYDETTDYRTQYTELDHNMRSLKNSNDFDQLNQGIHRKCKLCGQRISLFDNKKNDNSKILGKNEGLCAVCYVKRIYIDEKERNVFPSTAAVALSHWKKALLSTDNGKEYYEDYKKCFVSPFSEQYFYQDSISTQNINSNSTLIRTRAKAGEINAYMKQVYPYIIKRKYYALIAFDGDSMGKWMSGSYFKDVKNFKSDQQTVSTLLGEYADWVHSYLKINEDAPAVQLGSVIYAGGEDFFGFVPLENLCDVLKTLRTKFKEMISDKLKKISDSEFTFSAGVCIAHYKSPLSAVVAETRRMEKKAKEFRDNKDSIAINVMKRSGDTNCSVFGWRYHDDTGVHYIIDDIKAISIKLNKSFSDKYLRNIVQTIYEIAESSVSMKDIREEILADAFRFTERACLLEDDSKTDEIAQMKAHIQSLYDAFAGFESNKNSPVNFAHALLLAEFIRREQNDN